MDDNSISTPSASDPAPATTIAGPAQDESGADLPGADLAAAVDGLAELETAPVHTHAARYSDVHSVLQDALSDTDRGGANPR